MPPDPAAPERRFWLVSSLAILPAVVLTAVVALVPLRPEHQVVLTVVAANIFVLCCFVLQPLLLRPEAPAPLELAYAFLAHGLTVQDPSLVVELLPDHLEKAGIADRVLVAMPDLQGKLLLYGGDEADGEILAEWGGDLGAVAGTQAARAAAASDAAQPTLRELCRSLGCTRVLILHGRNVGLGAAFVREGTTRVSEEFWEAIEAHLTFLLVNRRLAGALENVSGSLTLGTPLQEALMPSQGTSRSAGVAFHSVLRLTPHCAGDTWTSRDLGDGKLLIFVGDATGHGPAAATLAVAVKGVVDGVALSQGTYLRLDRLFAEVDEVVRLVGQHRYVMSAIAAIIDVPRATITLANAGHPRPFLVDPRDKEATVRYMDTGAGSLLGTGTLSTEVRVLPLRPGSKWVFYTDGISEASVDKSSPYGHRRFRDILRTVVHGSPQVIADALLADVDRFTRGRPLDDDVVLVVVEIPNEGARGHADWRTPPPLLEPGHS